MPGRAMPRLGTAAWPIGTARVPNLGIARPTPAVYTVYRVDWVAFDSLRTERHRKEGAP